MSRRKIDTRQGLPWSPEVSHVGLAGHGVSSELVLGWVDASLLLLGTGPGHWGGEESPQCQLWDRLCWCWQQSKLSTWLPCNLRLDPLGLLFVFTEVEKKIKEKVGS